MIGRKSAENQIEQRIIIFVLFPAAEISYLHNFTGEEYPALQGQVINLGGFFAFVSVRIDICMYDKRIFNIFCTICDI